MMILFFLGIGASAVVVSLTQSPLQLALALALLGVFASIYHPVGIPMLLQGAQRPGLDHRRERLRRQPRRGTRRRRSRATS